MSSIKLPHASGNSMSIAAPATNPASDLELKLPATVGNAGQALINSSTAGILEFGTPAAASRNLIINGGMTIHQRTGDITSDGYSLDMFARQQSSDGAFTVSQSTTSPDGFSKSLKVDVTTADTSLAASQYAQIKTKIEAQDLQKLAYGTSAAKDITISFYVRSNKTGNYGLWIQQSDSSFKQVTLQYTISAADTWERKSFTISGDTSGNINDDTGDGFIIAWGLAAGSNKTSGSLRSTWTAHASADEFAGQAVNVLDSTSNEWYLTGVQVEVGSYVTDFEHRSYGDELARCQRYCFVQTLNNLDYTGFICAAISPNDALCTRAMPVPMRTIPSYTGTETDVRVKTGADNSNTQHFDDFSIDKMPTTPNPAIITLRYENMGGMTAGQCGHLQSLQNNGKLIFSAEL